MQKNANRILSALLALVMIVSMLPATVFATGETEEVLTGWNVVLGENIGVNFHLNKEGYTVTTTVDGVEVEPEISGSKVTVNVSAAQMTDTIGLTVKDGETVVKEGEYSVRKYAEIILNDEHDEYDDYVKQMVKEMLNYGAAAQTYFAHNTGDLANKGYELTPTATVPAEIPAISTTGTLPEGLELYGMTLIFQSRTAVRFYFKTTGNIADYTFKVGETPYTPVRKQGTYYIEVGNINPQNLHQPVTVTVNDGAYTVSYSPLDYIVRKYNNSESSDSLKALVKAMYGYHLEAKYYVSVVPVGSLQSSRHGWSTGGIYATMPENDAYFVQDDWGVEYTPVSADVIKLVRGGETTSVGVPGSGTLIKFTATDYYFKTENHIISGEVLPLVDQDYLIVEGRFHHPATGSVMYISKTYIYNNGGTLEFSTTEPVLPVSYDVGVLQAHNAGAGSGGIYFTTQEVNDAPWDDNWNTYYDSASVDCLKLVRNGETISVGLTGKNTICKFGENDYYLKLEEYTIGSYAPFTTDDMFIVEGAYTHANSKTTLNIAKTYIYHDGSAWVFADAAPVIEPETESPFTFDKGVFSADIFNNRNNGLSVSVENKQLKLQNPAGADTWLWIKQDLPAGTVVTMDVTFSGDGMGIFGYGSKENGDPITVQPAGSNIPIGWFNGQGGSTSGSYTFNIYEDCHGLSLNLRFGGSTKTAIYIDNVTIILPPETQSPFTFDCGTFSSDIFNNKTSDLMSVSVESKMLKLQGATENADVQQWLWIKQTMKAGTTVTMDVTFGAEGIKIFGYGSKANGDPISDGTPTESVPQGWFWGQGVEASGTHTLTIYEDCYGLLLWAQFKGNTEAPIYIDNIVITPPSEIVVNGGNMTENELGWDAAGEIYFTLTENDLPVDENAEIEYTAEAGVIKLVRGGNTSDVSGTVVKYGDTDYYFAFDSEALPLQDNDYLIVAGDFVNADNGYTLNIAKTYVLVDGENLIYSTTAPVIVSTYEVGVLNSHGAGVETGDNGIKGIYATSIATGATSGDWSIEYSPVATENYKLIRDGVTYNVGRPGEGTLVMFGQTEYYLKQETNTFDSSLLPLQKGDVLVVEGNWSCNKDAASVIAIDTTYILIVGESAVKFSADMPNIVKINVLKESQNPRADGGFYATADANSAPLNTDWSLRYKAQSSDAIKYVSNGVTSNVANTDGEMLVKYSEYDYYFEGWTLSGTYANIAAGDMYIVNGLFYNAANDVYIDIDTTYIKFTASDELFGSTEPDTTPAYEMGVLSLHSNGVRVNGGSIDGIYATGIAGTGAAYNMDWSYDYGPVSAENFKLIRDGVTYNVGVPGTRTLIMHDDGQFFLEILSDRFGGALPLQVNDILVLEGKFACNQNANSVINITTTYILVGNGVVDFSAEMPTLATVYNMGVLSLHSNGVRVNGGSIDGIYATGIAGTGAAYNTDWNYDYSPVSAENFKLIRDGVTYNVGVPGTRTLIMYGDGELFLEIVNGRFNGELPLQDEDILVLDGQFSCNQNAKSVINIDQTYILINNGKATFSATEPEILPAYELGVLTAHSNGVRVTNGAIDGIYATGKAGTGAAYNTDWNYDYSPVSAENYQLIRDGVTYNVGVPGTRTLIMYGDGELFLEIVDGRFNGELPLRQGDILVLHGKFICNQNQDSIVNIEKTYITIKANGTVFSATDPRIINVGTMYAHNDGYSTNDSGITGIYFMNDSNVVPANEDWTVRYKATDASNVKLIRNGATTNIAVVGANTIVKMSDQAGWLCLEGGIVNNRPIVAGDVLIVEGAFTNDSNGYTMVIDKTYIIVGQNGAVTFTTHYEQTDNFGAIVLPTVRDTLTFGTWAGSYHHFTDERLAELKNAGITKILGVSPSLVGGENNNDVSVLLDRCAKYGISIVVDLRGWDGSTVPAYASHPNLIGFLMYDEPNTSKFNDLAALKAKFDAVMPADKLFYVNLFPECAADSSLGELNWWDQIIGTDLDYDEDYVTAFLNALDIEVLSWDNYSLITDSSNKAGIRTDYFHNFEVMAGKNMPLWYTMLSAGHTAGASSTYYDTPTAEELRWQMAVAMTYGVQNIDHYVYYSHEDGYSCMLQKKENEEVYSTTDLYNDILTVDNEYLAWDHIFMAYDWQGVGVYDAGASNTMLNVLENKLNLANYGLTVNTSDQDLLVGVFDHNGDKAYMVTNAGTPGSTTVGDGKNYVTGDATVTLSLGSGSYKCVAVIDNGEISYVAVNADNTVTLNVEAYEGVFVIPVLN